MKAVMYGAGNIGRGFIGQLFYESGYNVTFIDVNEAVINALNSEREYPVRIVGNDGDSESMVRNVRAVNGNDATAVADCIAEADIIATAVGVNVLKFTAKPFALGISKRFAIDNFKPLNIIICENKIDASGYLRNLVADELPREYHALLDEKIGFVEASIGRMVPVQTPQMQDGNPLRVCVEAYSKLPCDKDAFRGEIPPIKNLLPFSPFSFYIERKLFIHNLGHAITAYLGYQRGYEYIWQAIGDDNIRARVYAAMAQSGAALAKKHGVDYAELQEHIDDLLRRFANKALGDTVARVGGDLRRKLSPSDRLIGSLKCCIEQGLPCDAIIEGIAAALCFTLDPLANEVPDDTLRQVCGLDDSSDEFRKIRQLYEKIKQ